VGGFTDGVGAAASFMGMDSLATDRAGNVYVAGNFMIRKITPNGVVSTLAGDGNTDGTTNGVGTNARFRYLPGMATDAAGNVYVTDARFCGGRVSCIGAPMIRKITPSGVVSTLAGPGSSPWIADGIGTAAIFDDPRGMVADSEGNIYVADSYNKHSIRKITPAGVVSTVVGGYGRFGFAAGALPGSLYRPSGLAISGTTLYITMLNGVAMVTNLP
jgi:sugar lactone lactonase YvrE